VANRQQGRSKYGSKRTKASEAAKA
jgi:hypothetical protein